MIDNRKKEVDIVNDILEECIIAYPVSSFVISLYKQYMQRGSLSKKQLQGLHSKASKIENIRVNKLATLEAIIKKMPTKTKSDLPENIPILKKDEIIAETIESILSKYPQHKRVLFLQSKYVNKELSASDIEEIKKFEKLLKIN
jgi:hypothetical protein